MMRVTLTIKADELKLAQLLAKFSETYKITYSLTRQNGEFYTQLDIGADDFGELVRRLNHIKDCTFQIKEIHGGGLLDRLNVRPTRTNVEALIGKITVAKTNINPLDGGIIQIGGELWSAHPTSEKVIKEGTKVKVVGIEGVSLMVEEVEG
ncbi:NfeD family protein [Candidatus Bathyarchaeota archaeon]|nr:NfeD family protein [Candidatus Bathyarchaeota archaeon]